MIDARVQVKEALEEGFENVPVKMAYPEGDVIFPIVTYAEVTNAHVSKWRDVMDYQIDYHASTFSDCVELMQKGDAIMTGLGFTRTYVTPDANTREGADHYHKATNYTAQADTHLGNILTGG